MIATQRIFAAGDALQMRFPRRIKLWPFLGLVGILCIAFGWFGYLYRDAQEKERAVRSLESLGAWVQFDYSTLPDGTPADTPALQRVFGRTFASRVVDVHFFSENLDNKNLSAEERLACDVGDRDLLLLNDCPDIESLFLNHSRVSNAGVSHLTKFRRLRMLGLTGTNVDDAVIPDLAKMKQLEYLFVGWTSISPEGLSQLRDALPKTTVVGGQPP